MALTPSFGWPATTSYLCWRMQDASYRLGFSPAAVVWHHRRNSVAAYWRQQRGYGKAEALLERKWPERYNAAGHVRWAGRLYGRGVALPLSRRQRVHHGKWGLGLFQSLYEPAPGSLSVLPLMPEWYLLVVVLAVLSSLGALWPPLLLGLPLLAGSVLTALAQAVRSTRHASFAGASPQIPVWTHRHAHADDGPLRAPAGRPAVRTARLRPLSLAPAPFEVVALAWPPRARILERDLAGARETRPGG